MTPTEKDYRAAVAAARAELQGNPCEETVAAYWAAQDALRNCRHWDAVERAIERERLHSVVREARRAYTEDPCDYTIQALWDAQDDLKDYVNRERIRKGLPVR